MSNNFFIGAGLGYLAAKLLKEGRRNVGEPDLQQFIKDRGRPTYTDELKKEVVDYFR